MNKATVVKGYTAQARYYAANLEPAAGGDWKQLGWTRLANGAVKQVFETLAGVAIVILDGGNHLTVLITLSLRRGPRTALLLGPYSDAPGGQGPRRRRPATRISRRPLDGLRFDRNVQDEAGVLDAGKTQLASREGDMGWTLTGSPR